jgi:hypothetical protein
VVDIVDDGESDGDSVANFENEKGNERLPVADVVADRVEGLAEPVNDGDGDGVDDGDSVAFVPVRCPYVADVDWVTVADRVERLAELVNDGDGDAV